MASTFIFICLIFTTHASVGLGCKKEHLCLLTLTQKLTGFSISTISSISICARQMCYVR